MRLSLAAALTATLASAMAFKDTSPFLMFSTSLLPDSLHVSKSQLQSSHAVLSIAKEFLKTCPSDIYFIISQPSVSSSELSSSAPHLKNAVENSAVKTRYGVSEVAGLVGDNADELAKVLQKECAAKRMDVDSPWKKSSMEGSLVVEMKMNGLGEGRNRRLEILGDEDSTLYTKIFQELKNHKQYTVIYTTTPSNILIDDQPLVAYEPSFTESFHMDLKRNFGASESNETAYDPRPLFEKYQFLSPGLFMGLLVSLLLLAILSVGINAVASLQVSYGAFDKEMGPAAQKKAQ